MFDVWNSYVLSDHIQKLTYVINRKNSLLEQH